MGVGKKIDLKGLRGIVLAGLQSSIRAVQGKPFEAQGNPKWEEYPHTPGVFVP